MKKHVADLEKRFKEKVKSLRFFDANCWIGRPNYPGPVYLNGADEIIAYLGHCGIQGAIVSHTLSRFSHPTVGNRLLLETLSSARSGSRTGVGRDAELIASFVLLPDATGELGNLDGYIDSMVKAGGRTVRLFPKSHNYSLKDWTCASLLTRLEERGVPLFVWPWETDKAHLYLGLDELVSRFGASRVIFGSNLPIDDPFASLMLVTDGDFSDDDREKIARGNLERLVQGVKT
jgi:hypothetical protein